MYRNPRVGYKQKSLISIYLFLPHTKRHMREIQMDPPPKNRCISSSKWNSTRDGTHMLFRKKISEERRRKAKKTYSKERSWESNKNNNSHRSEFLPHTRLRYIANVEAEHTWREKNRVLISKKLKTLEIFLQLSHIHMCARMLNRENGRKEG